MNLIGAVIGGAIGALIGGAIWVAVGYATNYEIGWIAWGVGALAGVGAAAGSKGQGGQAAGMVAVVLAIASIVIAKYVVVQLMIDHEVAKSTSNFQKDLPDTSDSEFWTLRIADDLVSEQEEAGKTLHWPQGKTHDTAERGGDYPYDIWHDATRRFAAMTPEAKAKYREDSIAFRKQVFDAITTGSRSAFYKEGFLASFGAYDLLFGFLAIASAFRLGSGAKAKT